MRSERHGASTSTVEVLGRSHDGISLHVDGHDLFLPFEFFPWFRDRPDDEIRHVVRPSANHLYWPALDVDLAIDSLEHPERYPLQSRRR